jgi:hypothetical protein
MDHREASPVFEFTLPSPPEANIFDLQEPLTRKAVSDGYWMLLKPLTPRRHDIVVTLRMMGLDEELPLHYGITVGPCEGASFRRGDANGDRMVNLTDAVSTLSQLVQGGSAPPAPGPDECGADPTAADELGSQKGC